MDSKQEFDNIASTSNKDQAKIIQSELLKPIVGRILEPAVFDQSLLNGEFPISNTQSCTTMTLPRFLNDLQGKDMDHEQWIKTFPPKTHFEKKGVGPFKKTITREEHNPLPFIQQNREYYGWQMGLRDAINSLNPEAAKDVFSGDYAEILYVGREYANKPKLDTLEDLHDLIRVANTYHDAPPKDITVTNAANKLLKAIGSLEGLKSVVDEAVQRRGVQVVYGGEGYNDFFNDTVTVGRDSGDFAVVCLERRIPSKFMTAIIPIGQYEREKLLATK